MENRVEELRKGLGMNQEEFAKILKVSRQTVSSIETGKYIVQNSGGTGCSCLVMCGASLCNMSIIRHHEKGEIPIYSKQ